MTDERLEQLQDDERLQSLLDEVGRIAEEYARYVLEYTTDEEERALLLEWGNDEWSQRTLEPQLEELRLNDEPS